MKYINMSDNMARSSLVAQLSVLKLSDSGHEAEVNDILEGLFRGSLMSMLEICVIYGKISVMQDKSDKERGIK